MRPARAFAAAVFLALALPSPGCDLVDSLTPFGIGHQDSGVGSENVNGIWGGTTSPTGGEVAFQVGDNTLLRPRFQHLTTGCTLTFEDTAAEVRVIDGGFTIEILLDQGKFVATGTFGSDRTCSGDYTFEGLPAGDCPTDGTGTFAAEKTL